MRVPPSGPLTASVFGMVTAGLPRRVSCLATAQAWHEAESRGEACALANSGCLIACLIAQTATRGATERLTQALPGRRAQGLPRYRTGQGPLPDGSTGVEGPLYRPNGDRQNRRLRKLTRSGTT
jgi:hypothetical protein